MLISPTERKREGQEKREDIEPFKPAEQSRLKELQKHCADSR